MSNIIEIKNLSFRYQQANVLQNINLTVREGEQFVLLGPNGGGKTTLIKLILGIIRPTIGEVYVFGDVPGTMPERVGYIPQYHRLHYLLPILVQEVVLMGLNKEERKQSKEVQREKARKAMKQVHVNHLAKRQFNTLSGGERQRVFMARALIDNPPLLILDEPTASVDPYATSCFFDILASLSREVTVLIVSHDLSILAANVDKVACINRSIYYEGSARLTPEMLNFFYGITDHECTAAKNLAKMASLVSQVNKDRFPETRG